MIAAAVATAASQIAVAKPIAVAKRLRLLHAAAVAKLVDVSKITRGL